MSDLSRFTTLTFDCYGTLIDWETGIWDALQPLLLHNRADHVHRADALEAFAQLESVQQEATPELVYPRLLAQVHHAFAQRFDLRTHPDIDAAFGASVPHWPAFPDSADALRRLERRFGLVVLSNVDRAGFAASSRKLGVMFQAIYTAEDIGSYKPARRNFQVMIDDLEASHGVATEEILHVAQSLFHDHVPAAEIDLATAWIDRQDLAGTGSWGATARVAERPTVDHRFRNLAALADAAEETTDDR